MIEKLNKIKIFQLCFGAFRSAVNRCDIMITNVFDDNLPNQDPRLLSPENLHIVAVKIADPLAASSSGTIFSLDPTTPANITPPRAVDHHSQQTHPLTMESPFGASLLSHLSINC